MAALTASARVANLPEDTSSSREWASSSLIRIANCSDTPGSVCPGMRYGMPNGSHREHTSRY